MPTEGLAHDHVKKEPNLQDCWPMTGPLPVNFNKSNL
jgi:hypothetical protein